MADQIELTPEIIISGLEKPELKEALLGHLSSSGLIIRTQDEDQSYLNNHVSAVAEERAQAKIKELLPAEFGKALGSIDKEIFEITGIEKTNGEKTTAYAKRAIEALKAKGGDPITKQRVKELEDQLNSTKTEYETKLSETQKALFTREIEWGVNAALDGVNIATPAHLKTDEERQAYVAQQKTLIKQGFLAGFTPKKDDAGNIVFYKGDTPQLNQKDGSPKTASDLISEAYAAWFVPKTHTATGTGQGAPQSGSEAGLKTKDDVHKYLESQGFDAEDPGYTKAFSELCGKLGIKAF